MDKKDATGKLKGANQNFDMDYELKSTSKESSYPGFEGHHMPASDQLPGYISAEKRACANIPKDIHKQTFTNGMSQSNRPYDYALYSSLEYEDQLSFDNANLVDLYDKMRPSAESDIVRERIQENYEFSMDTKKNAEEEKGKLGYPEK